jgi:2-polyprenyl-3-methyl-5-hydroxy-6-metoxy-1,4-benzoquinol methylase
VESVVLDVILAIGILHLLNDRRQTMKRINELLKPGGFFLSSTACKGESAAIPTVMNGICSILSFTGMFPYLNFPYVAELEREIVDSRFRLERSESYSFGTVDKAPPSAGSYIIAHFVSAVKL